MKGLFIFYVKEQLKATQFYKIVLQLEPTLDVPGMTEFTLQDGSKFGLMPEKNIKALLGEKLPDPAEAAGIPRAEIYIIVDKAKLYHERVLANGGQEISSLSDRSWGHRVAYSLDLDEHVLAFAEEI